MRRLWLILLSLSLRAQTPGSVDTLIRDLRSAVHNESLNSAAELANKLDDAVQQRYISWLTRDRHARVNEVLAWLPADMESLFVNQRPFAIIPSESLELLDGRPIQQYSVDRLMAQNGGSFYQAMNQRTVRLVVAAMRNISTVQSQIPSPIAKQDVTYFYFFDGPFDLPPPDESVSGVPVWHASATINKEGEQEIDENWMALAKPELLILTNRRELLAQILQNLAGASKTRALPSDLPEWKQVDQNASFWALRHYSAQSKPARGEPGFAGADLPRPDGSAVGITTQFDDATQRLEVHYLSSTPLRQKGAIGDSLYNEFQIDSPEAGVSRLVSDVAARGAFPVDFAMAMLGFGAYR